MQKGWEHHWPSSDDHSRQGVVLVSAPLLSVQAITVKSCFRQTTHWGQRAWSATSELCSATSGLCSALLCLFSLYLSPSSVSLSFLWCRPFPCPLILFPSLLIFAPYSVFLACPQSFPWSPNHAMTHTYKNKGQQEEGNHFFLIYGPTLWAKLML